MAYTAYNQPYKNNDPGQGPSWARRFDDFDKAYPTGPVTASSPYNSIASNTGTFTQPAQTAANGVALLSGAATTTKSGIQIQRDMANIVLGLGVTCNLSVRVALSDATNSDFVFGIGTLVAATTPVLNGNETAPVTSNIAGATYVDFVGLYKPYAQTLFYPIQNKTSGSLTAGAAIGAATTSFTQLWMNIVMDPAVAAKGVVSFYQDDVLLVSYTSTTLPALNLAEMVGMLSATATGTISMQLDWIDCSVSR